MFMLLILNSFFSDSNVPTLTAYDKDGLKIIFSLLTVPNSNTLTINVTATNHTVSNMTDFLFQVAVPRVSSVLYYICTAAWM